MTPSNFILAIATGHRRRRDGFSLIELLAVVGIMSVLLGFLGPALRGTGGQSLDNGVRTLANLLNAARSEAIAKHTVVRFVVARAWTNQPSSNYRAASLWAYDSGAGQFFQDTGWETLPEGIILESGSPAYVRSSAYAAADGSSIRGDYTLSTAFAQYDYQPPTLDGSSIVTRYLDFLPTGGIRVAGGTGRNAIFVATQGYLGASGSTITYTNAPTGSPGNWAQINADELTGRVRIYRP